MGGGRRRAQHSQAVLGATSFTASHPRHWPGAPEASPSLWPAVGQPRTPPACRPLSGPAHGQPPPAIRKGRPPARFPRPHLASSLSSQLRLKPPVLPPPHLQKSRAHCRAWGHGAAGSGCRRDTWRPGAGLVSGSHKGAPKDARSAHRPGEGLCVPAWTLGPSRLPWTRCLTVPSLLFPVRISRLTVGP